MVCANDLVRPTARRGATRARQGCAIPSARTAAVRAIDPRHGEGSFHKAGLPLAVVLLLSPTRWLSC
jgi:hypothetical protein